MRTGGNKTVKLSPLAILMIGLMFGVIGLTYGLFQRFLPNMNDARLYSEWGEKLDAEGGKLPQAVKRVETAQAKVKEINDKWDQTVRVKTPPASVSAGGVNVAVNPYQLTVDSLLFRDNVQSAVNRQVKAGGVTVVTGPLVPAPTDDPETIMSSYYNYPNTPYPVAIFDMGQVEVRGTFSQIAENIRAWSRMPNYLAVADGLVITGTAPQLTARYNVTLVAFVRGKKISPTIQMARDKAVAGAAAAAGVAPGGVPALGAPGGVPATDSRGGGRGRDEED
ncbi:hypothetical protein CCB80_11985 [Armatimonadetes bacterium Uphvl-Ar1]|nr:hypothetical protein CCB80_11985 [Armatimonadetes bacterium Uphvl-Ar1]